MVYWAAVGGVWVLILVVGLVAYNAVQLPPIDQLSVPKRPPNIAILAADGSLIANRGDSGGPTVRLSDLPPYLPEAFIAIEDRRFYRHWGIDPIGIVRAVVNDIAGRRGLEGGSTLTQQLARNLFLTQQRTLARKVQEAILSVWLERKYSKNQILELYLNRVYFGSGAWGVEAASEKYFGRPARTVTLAQAAELAGLMKAPSKLAPDRNPDGAQKRASDVVQAMEQQGYISDSAAKAALADPARTAPRSSGGAMNYAADYVMDELSDTLGSIDQDVRVQTSLDPALEAAGQAALQQVLARDGESFGVSQGALIAMEPNGAIRALIGGYDYSTSQFNRVSSAHRQPGSTFKPFVYLAALERGLTPDTIREDAPITVRGWSPSDAERRYIGPVSLTRALARSLNTVAVRLGLEVGTKTIAATAHRLGIDSDLQPDLSIVLGTSDVTPLELTSSYAPFANGGFLAPAHAIESVRTTHGKILFDRGEDPHVRVVKPEYVAMMNAMLQQTILAGTAKRAVLPGWQAAGKTGTSQQNRDGWFVGYTARLVTGVWLGNDDSSPTKGLSGGNLPAQVWGDFMRTALAGQPPAPLPSDGWPRATPSLFDSLFSSTAPQAGAPPGASQPIASTYPPTGSLDPGASRRSAPQPAGSPRAGGVTPPADIPSGPSRNDPRAQKSFLDELFGG